MLLLLLLLLYDNDEWKCSVLNSESTCQLLRRACSASCVSSQACGPESTPRQLQGGIGVGLAESRKVVII